MAVTLADIRFRVIDELKRKDVPVATLDRWIMDSIRRIQRTLRTPIDEAVSGFTVPPGFNGLINVPGNLVELLEIRCDDVVLTMRTAGEVKRLAKAQGRAEMFAREAGQYIIAPLPPAGSTVTLVYRADFANPVQPIDSLKLFDVAADLVAYGALILAASWAVDDKRMMTWNSEYVTAFGELQDLSDRTELLNASIAPAYNYNGDWNP